MGSPFPADAIARYRKLQAVACAVSAAPQERVTASRKIGELESEYPGIGVEATRPEPAAPSGSSVPPRDAAGFGAFADGLFGTLFGKAAEFVKTLDQTVERDRAFRRMFKLKSNVTRSGKVSITVELEPRDADRLLDWLAESRDYRETVAWWLGQRVAEEFNEVIDDLEDE